MHPQELSIELPSQGARRATEEGSQHGWQKPQRFSARQKTEVVLRLLRGEPLDLVSRELEIPAARLTTWREAFLDAGQDALKKPLFDNHDRSIGNSPVVFWLMLGTLYGVMTVCCLANTCAKISSALCPS